MPLYDLNIGLVTVRVFRSSPKFQLEKIKEIILYSRFPEPPRLTYAFPTNLLS